MTEARVHRFGSPADAARALAAEIARTILQAHAARGKVTVALAGGGTPRALHRILAREHRELPWSDTHIFWGDERFVPHASEQSNYRMARETLLDEIEIHERNLHPWGTDLLRPEEAALDMERELECHFAGAEPRFDLIVLGVGADGHTASLFPASPALRITDRLVATAEAPDEPRQRLTFTLPVLNNARAVHFLVSGADKRAAVECALRPGQQPERCPASMVRPADGTLSWWLDEEAAP